MYLQHFGLGQDPFSIAPDPRFLYMSERHREALAHLLYGLEAGGGFVLLTGDIGAGKTTVCRCFLEQVPVHCRVAYVFNPKLSVVELLAEVCREFGLEPLPAGGPATASVKAYVDPLNRFLLDGHASGRNSVLVIDEAQQLSAEVLEQLRLLTNLETNERKLLQIVLIGQPELREMLARPELEQLAQRVIARYHLGPLDLADTGRYLLHRLEVAGLHGASPIGPALLPAIHRHSGGVPRRINLLCDRALLGAYSQGLASVDRRTLDQAMREVPARPHHATPRRWTVGWRGAFASAAILAALLGVVSWQASDSRLAPGPAATVSIPAIVDPAASGGSPTVAASAGTAAATAGPAEAALDVADAEALRALIEPSRDEAGVYRALAARWGVDLPPGPACAVALRADLVCHESAGGLGLLRQLDRPALLRLRVASDGAPRSALLLALGGQQAVLGLGDNRYRVPLGVLADAWRGDFSTFWRRPAAHPGGVPVPTPPALVGWLDQHLPPVSDAAAAPTAVEPRLMAFQLAQGLQPDGMPGPLTMMALNRHAGVDEPRLLGVVP